MKALYFNYSPYSPHLPLPGEKKKPPTPLPRNYNYRVIPNQSIPTKEHYIQGGRSHTIALVELFLFIFTCSAPNCCRTRKGNFCEVIVTNIPQMSKLSHAHCSDYTSSEGRCRSMFYVISWPRDLLLRHDCFKLVRLGVLVI